MNFLTPWLVLAVVIIGHFGFWLILFNRINGTGLQRPTIKRLEKLFIAAAILIPLAVASIDFVPLTNWLLSAGAWWPSDTTLFNPWAWLSLATVILAGPLWLQSRFALWHSPKLLSETSQHYFVSQHVDSEILTDPVFRWFNKLPGNQITQMQVTHKEIELPRAILGIEGLKIAHLSDIHLTGKVSQDYYHFAVDRVLEAKPDLIVIAGDIIDYAHCLPWIRPLLGRLQAPLGCSFVLGNHDRRLDDVSPLLEQLTQLGHHDLGAADQRLRTDRGVEIWLSGNERPWFHRQKAEDALQACEQAPTSASTAPAVVAPSVEPIFRMGVSHSPDQIGWARERRMDLMLAGHTHGGQIRLPLLGPLVAPSYYGSRYASGLFYLHPTVMHVGRGLSGVHPLRWFCLPEVSILTLKNPTTDKEDGS
jgi:uncharacterized protein